MTGISFTSENIRQIMAGQKTQTRRAMKPQPLWLRDGNHWQWMAPDGAVELWNIRTPTLVVERCPYGRPSEQLWVKEAWRTFERPSDLVDGTLYKADGAFRATENTDEAADRWVDLHRNGYHGDAWRPPRHMPRWVSRLTLEVVGTSIQLIQGITAAEIRQEGVACPKDGPDGWHCRGRECPSLREAFVDLWQSINRGALGWARNPWVWVVTFRLVEA